jgi:hypothetical protein
MHLIRHLKSRLRFSYSLSSAITHFSFCRRKISFVSFDSTSPSSLPWNFLPTSYFCRHSTLSVSFDKFALQKPQIRAQSSTFKKVLAGIRDEKLYFVEKILNYTLRNLVFLFRNVYKLHFVNFVQWI